MPIKSIWTVSFIISLLGFFGPNPFEFIAAVLTVPFLCSLFLPHKSFVVVLFGFLMQWLCVCIKIFYGYAVNLRLEEVIPRDISVAHIYEAFWLSLIGIWVFALGFYWAASGVRKTPVISMLDEQLMYYSPRKIVIALIVFHFGFTFLYVFRFIIPGLNSVLSVIGQLKWGLYLVAFYIVHKQNDSKKIFYIFSAFLFVTGFGFFSGFKEVLFFAMIGVVVVSMKVTLKQGAVLSLLLFLIVQILLVWTAVKGEYRMFLSGGERTIRVVRSQGESLSYLWNLVSEVDKEDMVDATEDLVDRISYISYFSLALRHVPDRVPHQDGKIWSDAVMHIFMPRAFFPNKPVIDDSEHTTKYTGRVFSGLGTASFSLGYTADAYIDYGKLFMFVPIFLLGFVMGKVFQFLLLRSADIVWGTILTAPFFFFTNVYGMNVIKVLGLFFAYTIFILITRKLIVKYSAPFLLKASGQ